MKVTVRRLKGKGISLIGGDVVGGKPVTVTQASAANASNSNIEALDFAVTSFAWRKNTGSQPVPDDCPVICQSASEPNVVSELMACNVDWELDNCEQFKWKPDLEKLAKMLSEEKKENAIVIQDSGIEPVEVETVDFSDCDIYERYFWLIDKARQSDEYRLGVKRLLARFEGEIKAEEKSESALDIGIKMHEEILGSDKKEWNGEGLPPVGELCEVRFRADGEWSDWFSDAVFKAGFDSKLWFAHNFGDCVYPANDVEFRKIGETERLAKRNEAGRDLYVLYTQLAINDYSCLTWDSACEAVREQWRKLAERATVNDWSDGDLPY